MISDFKQERKVLNQHRSSFIIPSVRSRFSTLSFTLPRKSNASSRYPFLQFPTEEASLTQAEENQNRRLVQVIGKSLPKWSEHLLSLPQGFRVRNRITKRVQLLQQHQHSRAEHRTSNIEQTVKVFQTRDIHYPPSSASFKSGVLNSSVLDFNLIAARTRQTTNHSCGQRRILYRNTHNVAEAYYSPSPACRDS